MDRGIASLDNTWFILNYQNTIYPITAISKKQQALLVSGNVFSLTHLSGGLGYLYSSLA